MAEKRHTALVSACVLGCACRYDGASKPNEAVLRLREKMTLIPFCPEIYGGLATPRVPAERIGEKVVTRDGEDVTEQYHKGAAEALRLAKLFACDCAILQDRSPSCGKGRIHDGSFTGILVDGNGVTAELLLRNGIRVFSASEVGLMDKC